jgi:hypothetical protein
VGAIINDAMPVVEAANFAIEHKGGQPPGWGAVSIPNVRANFTFCAANGITPVILSSDLFNYALGRKASGVWRSNPSATPLQISAAFSSRDMPVATFTLQGTVGLCAWLPCASFFHDQLSAWNYSICHTMLSPLANAGVVGVVGNPLLDLDLQAAATTACVAGFKATEEGVVSLAASLVSTSAGVAAFKGLLAASPLPTLVQRALHIEIMYRGSGALALKAQMKGAAVAAVLKKAGQVLSPFHLHCLEGQAMSGAYFIYHCLA